MKKLVFVFVLLFIPVAFQAQEKDSDELFKEARDLAFEKKDYPAAIKLSKEALEQSPNYTDISVFLARLYTWSDQPQEARKVFAELEERGVKDEDFFLAYSSLEYWNDNSEKALEILGKGLEANPSSEPLLLLQSKVLFSEDKYEEAEAALDKILEQNPSQEEARALLVKVQDYGKKNAVGISYVYTHFDKQFDKDWHLMGLSYKRATPIGSVIVRGNLASRFGSEISKS